jgi:hypothetical protein
VSVEKKLTPVARILARAGCLAIGTVYVLIGTWAMFALLRVANPAADEQRILQRMLHFPLGNVFIAVIVLGTVGYILWLVFEAVFDPYELGSSRKGLTMRTGTGLSALAYGVIVTSGVKVLLGSGENGEEKREWLVARVLDWPAGEWLIGAAGVLVAVAGLYQIKFVYDRDHERRVRMEARSWFGRALIQGLAWTGYLARCAILLVLGGFLLSSAWSSDPRAVGDTDSAFDFLGFGGGSVGDAIFSVVAVGTINYGIFMWLNAVYFDFGHDDPEAA